MVQATRLSIRETDSRDGRVVVRMSDEQSSVFELELSPFDVSTLVSGLYASRDEALKQPPDPFPEVMLPLYGISIGEGGSQVFLRLHVTEHHHQDYVVPKDGPMASVIQALGELLAKAPGQKGPPDAPAPPTTRRH